MSEYSAACSLCGYRDHKDIKGGMYVDGEYVCVVCTKKTFMEQWKENHEMFNKMTNEKLGVRSSVEKIEDSLIRATEELREADVKDKDDQLSLILGIAILLREHYQGVNREVPF